MKTTWSAEDQSIFMVKSAKPMISIGCGSFIYGILITLNTYQLDEMAKSMGQILVVLLMFIGFVGCLRLYINGSTSSPTIAHEYADEFLQFIHQKANSKALAAINSQLLVLVFLGNLLEASISLRAVGFIVFGSGLLMYGVVVTLQMKE